MSSLARKGQEETLVEKGNLRFSAGGEWTPRIEVLGDEGSGEGRLPGSGNILKLKKKFEYSFESTRT